MFRGALLKAQAVIIRHDVPLGRLSTLRVGGTARTLVVPAETEELAAFLAEHQAIPTRPHVLGMGSNVLVADGEIAAPVILMSKFKSSIAVDGLTGRISASAGTSLPEIALRAAAAGIAGLEYLAVIPGSLGGGVRMNCGVGGPEGPAIADHLVEIDLLDLEGELQKISAADARFSYRSCDLAISGIVVGAALEGEAGQDPDAIRAEMDALRRSRRERQPATRRTSGSVWLPHLGRPAGALLDEIGLKGFSVGRARLSEHHANWIVTRSGCTAAEVEELVTNVEMAAIERAGADLELELKRVR